MPVFRPVVYLATPVRAASPTERRWNHLRAVVLARLAAAEGMAPVVPLLTVAGALEGFPLAAPATHDPRPMECCLSLLRAVHVAGGRLWLLERAEGGLSAGCSQELGAWRRWMALEGCTRQQEPVSVVWGDLGERMCIAHLGEAWGLLLGSPSDQCALRVGDLLNPGLDPSSI